jgi:hypothetical protein
MLRETPGCTGEGSSECKCVGILICKMPTSMRAVTCNINYRRLAIGNTKENTPMDRTWEDEACGLVSQGLVDNCAGMRLMLDKACWTKGMVTCRHIGKYSDTSLAYA